MPTGLVSSSSIAVAEGVHVNDVHSRLNEATVARVVRVTSVEVLRAAIREAALAGVPIVASGSRHAMGGQQFARGGWLLDMRPLKRILMLDRERGLVTVEAGIEWPDLIAELERLQPHARASDPAPWSIVQKQTGADRLTLGGALAANIHGRGLQLAPIVSNVESFLLVDAAGELRTCSRNENVELFRGAIGGYGLLGVIAAVTLRLERRYQLIRRVEIRDTHGLIDAFNRRIGEHCTFGDFQFATDATHDSFLRTGVFSCYQRIDVGDATSDAADVGRGMPRGTVLVSPHQRALSPEDWRRLAYLAHVDKSRAFEMYARHYLSTEGQVYWSDTHQLAFYEPEYHAHLDTQPGVAAGTEMITEIYVPRAALEAYLEDARRLLRERRADLIYGTIRLIERDEETVLAWAREAWACIIFNLHVTHTADGIARSAETFRGLIDLAIAHGGSYYLTYHRWATPAQLRRCHPRFDEFVALKQRVDPDSLFQSDWYRHYAPHTQPAHSTHLAQAADYADAP
jgi:FAD/FMN-containing dehydrogenase